MAKRETAYVYARVSTKTNKDKAGLTRQLEAARADAHRRALRVTESVCEVVSGTLPANQRTIFHELLDKAQRNGVKEVIMENGRTLARDVVVSESLRQAAQARGVRLRSSDMPTMFDNNPNPTQRFQDWVQMGYFQLEKDLAVQRMVHGLAEKHKRIKTALRSASGRHEVVVNGRRHSVRQLRTQNGSVKANGRKSILQTLTLTSRQKQKAAKACRRRECGDIGWRTLASELSEIFGLPNTMSPEAARRNSKSLLL
jgi:DNA invertase Pin-like site-specific DNA recombinase